MQVHTYMHCSIHFLQKVMKYIIVDFWGKYSQDLSSRISLVNNLKILNLKEWPIGKRGLKCLPKNSTKVMIQYPHMHVLWKGGMQNMLWLCPATQFWAPQYCVTGTEHITRKNHMVQFLLNHTVQIAGEASILISVHTNAYISSRKKTVYQKCEFQEDYKAGIFNSIRRSIWSLQ